MPQHYKINDYKWKKLKRWIQIKKFSLIMFHCNSQKLTILQNSLLHSNNYTFLNYCPLDIMQLHSIWYFPRGCHILCILWLCLQHFGIGRADLINSILLRGKLRPYWIKWLTLSTLPDSMQYGQYLFTNQLVAVCCCGYECHVFLIILSLCSPGTFLLILESRTCFVKVSFRHNTEMTGFEFGLKMEILGA